jgi:hypothetical protein
MEFKLNKNYTLKNIAITHAKQNNLSVMLTYYAYRPGEDMIVEHVNFFVYDNLENLCHKIIYECLDVLRNEDWKDYEIPDYLTNDEIKITLGPYKALCIHNIPVDKINIANYDEKICETIKENLDEVK